MLNAFAERCVDADGYSVAVVGQALQRVLYAIKKMCISHCMYLPCVVFSKHECIQSHPFVVWVKEGLV